METAIQAVATLVTFFLGMRVLYGSWPWEENKTWYATRRVLMDKDRISLSPQQIAHAVASAASVADNQVETGEGRLKTDSERIDAVIKDLRSDAGSATKSSETSNEGAPAEKSSAEGVEEKMIAS